MVKKTHRIGFFFIYQRNNSSCYIYLYFIWVVFSSFIEIVFSQSAAICTTSMIMYTRAKNAKLTGRSPKERSLIRYRPNLFVRRNHNTHPAPIVLPLRLPVRLSPAMARCDALSRSTWSSWITPTRSMWLPLALRLLVIPIDISPAHDVTSTKHVITAITFV